jgi:diaminohydroxyphosphoribosylaminopyrimidine deaminase / 5-amino-6-(5-phosphoribosylamino)uracil reductase
MNDSPINIPDDFMRAAFRMALSRCGHTSPNPPVGALVVRDGQILARGGTQRCGEDHAEVCALRDAGDAARGADMYVTLEPCSHWGRTPPCAEAIIRAGVRRVFIPILDPNPKVSGGGVRMLSEAGIETILLHSCRDQAIDLLRPFLTGLTFNRSHVIHKYAMTLDGRTAPAQGRSWISSEISRFGVHRLRGMCDAVMVGVGTVLADDPRLDVRIDEHAASIADARISFAGEVSPSLAALYDETPLCVEHPLRVVIGWSDQYSDRIAVFRDDNFRVFVRASDASDAPLYNAMRDAGRLIEFPDSGFGRSVLEHLYGIGTLSVLLEGGARLAARFFSDDLIDEVYAFVAPTLYGAGRPVFDQARSHGRAANEGSDQARSHGRAANEGSDQARLQPLALYNGSSVWLDGDFLYHGYTRRRSDVYRYY